MNVTIEGINELRVTLRRLGTQAKTGMATALYEEANDIMREAKKEAPVDLGPLRASGTVEPPFEVSGEGVAVELGFGGAASQYAMIQHERLDYHHTSGNAKFLEGPMLRAANGMAGRLAGIMRRVFGV